MNDPGYLRFLKDRMTGFNRAYQEGGRDDMKAVFELVSRVSVFPVGVLQIGGDSATEGNEGDFLVRLQREASKGQRDRVAPTHTDESIFPFEITL
jgi:hypothetical protein